MRTTPQTRKVALLSLIVGLLGSGSISTISSFDLAPAQAVQLANGKVFFDSVPTLKGAATTFSSTDVSGATYYFEIDVPTAAGESLKQVQIQQKEGLDRVKFNLGRTRAYLDKRRGTEVEIDYVELDDQNRVTIAFVEAIAPGNQLILAMRPYWNPDTGGVYLFGVTALPEGDIVHPQFLGYGRLHFYERDGFFGWDDAEDIIALADISDRGIFFSD